MVVPCSLVFNLVFFFYTQAIGTVIVLSIEMRPKQTRVESILYAANVVSTGRVIAVEEEKGRSLFLIVESTSTQ